MTRDEAIKVLRRTLFNDDNIPKELQDMNEPCAGGWIDAFAALGMLKLDEPESAALKFADIIHELFDAAGYIQLWDSLEKNNLRIVEK